MDRRLAGGVTLPICIYPSDENHLPFIAETPVLFNWTGIITTNLRRRIERDVDLLIALLDALEPDPDLDGGVGDEDGCEAEDRSIYGGGMPHEDEDCEPSLGWTNLGVNLSPGQNGALDDLEDATADLEPDNGDVAENGPHTPDGGFLGGYQGIPA
jgi:hypothetical protein